MTKDEIQLLVKALVPPLKEKFNALDDRIKTLEQAWAGLEHKQQSLDQRMKWRSVWDPQIEYQQGNFVTLNGAMWHAQVDSKGLKPGENGAWKLAVMKGKAGNDLR